MRRAAMSARIATVREPIPKRQSASGTGGNDRTATRIAVYVDAHAMTVKVAAATTETVAPDPRRERLWRFDRGKERGRSGRAKRRARRRAKWSGPG